MIKNFFSTWSRRALETNLRHCERLLPNDFKQKEILIKYEKGPSLVEHIIKTVIGDRPFHFIL